MRVMQVISSSETSGAERHVLSLSEQLQARRHQVRVICPPSGWLPNELRRRHIPLNESNMNGRGWMRTALQIARTARRQRFDLIHSHLTRASYIAHFASLVARVPLVSTVHVSNRDPIYKLVARRRNRLIAVSNYVRGILYGRGVPDRFIETVYNGTDFLELPRLNDHAGLKRESRLIGVVGQVCRDKGHLLLVSALPKVLAHHPQAHMVFVGRVDIRFENELQQAMCKHSVADHITITGNRSDVSNLLDAFEFTAMPSRKEAFGVAAIEAMARERPVIASRIGGLPEVVKHRQTGLLFDLRAEEVSDALHYMLMHREECRQMGKRGRELVEERFTLKEMVNKLEQIYLQVL